MNFYEQTARGYNELHGEEQEAKMKVIRDTLDLKKNDLLLDVGCGTGISSKFDCEVVSVDPTLGLLKQNSNSNRFLAQGEYLPFKDHVFDVVVCVSALHNFSDFEKGIHEMKRVGRDRFVFSILKKANDFDRIVKVVSKEFAIVDTLDGNQDIIYFCR